MLAGCGALLGAGPSEPSTETLTPVPVETRAQSATQSTPPPGVSVDGAVDVGRLLRAHTASLDGRSYTWVLTYDTGSREGTRLTEYRHPGGSLNRTLYVEDSTGYVRVDTDSGSEFDSRADPGEDETYAIGKELAWRYLTGVNLTADAVTQGGQTYYRLSVVDDVPAPLTVRGGLKSRIDEYRATASITQDGVVKTLITEYVRTSDDGYQYVSLRFDYEAIGRTTVTRPDWADQVTTGPGQDVAPHSTPS